ncbi:MAG: MBL fold metallo-hydrolase [Clostridiales bacterium]|nr:MBL fold metallo-hydrolase [Clostridiales bacterium]
MADNAYGIVQIDGNSWQIEEGMVRSLLFAGTKKALLVDTGFGKGSIKDTAESLTDKPIMLVNSHADGDHVGCNGQFAEAYMHPAEFAGYQEACPDGAIARPLWEGDSIDLGGRVFEVILIPGHTPGSIALLDRENRILVSGDSISESPIFMFGKTRSLNAYIHSMQKLMALSGAFDQVYPSHGPCPLEKDRIGKLIDFAGCVLRGEVEGTDPPYDLPAKLYRGDGAAFFYPEIGGQA